MAALTLDLIILSERLLQSMPKYCQYYKTIFCLNRCRNPDNIGKCVASSPSEKYDW